MYRLTTPTHLFDFPEDPSLYSKIQITYSQMGKIVLTKTKENMLFEETEDHHYGKVNLSQEETELFMSEWDASVQVRVLTNSGKSYASEIFTIRVYPVLSDNVLSEDENGLL